MNFIIILLIKGLDIYLWLIIASIIMSWLLLFGVLNSRNRLVHKVWELLARVTEPPMQKLRRFIPPVGNIDFTPMVVIFGIYLLQNFLHGMLRY